MIVNELLDSIARTYPGPTGAPASDYRLAELLEVSKQTVSKYRSGEILFDDDVCHRVAAILDMDPAYIITWIHAERARDPIVKQTWLRMAKQFPMKMARKAGAVLLAFALFGGPTPPAAHASTAAAPVARARKRATKGTLHIMSNGLAALWTVIYRTLARTVSYARCAAVPSLSAS